MMKNNVNFPETSKREWKFKPLRTALICVLIVALFVSMSVGLSYAKYKQRDSISPSFPATGLTFESDPDIYTIQERVPGEDTVFYPFGDKVKITVPAAASGANLTDADYLVLRKSKQSYVVDYTKSTGQYAYDCKYYLIGCTYKNDDYGYKIGYAYDDSKSITVELKVGSEYVRDLEYTFSPSVGASHQYDPTKQAVVFSGIEYMSETSNTSTYQLMYDKPDWNYDKLNADDISLNYSSDTVYIGSAEELADVAYLVNYGVNSFEGKKLVLTSDIDLHSANDLNLALNDGTKEKRPWVPIGTVSHPFKGSFIGNGYTISGLNIRDFKSYQVDSPDDYTAGLFGYVSADAGSISIGGFTIDDAHVSAKLSAYNSVEGQMSSAIGVAVGRTYGKCDISDVSISNAVITSESKYLGGITGYLATNGSISSCSVSGTEFRPTVAQGTNTSNVAAYQMGGIVGLQSGGIEDRNGDRYYTEGYNVTNCSVSADMGGSYDSCGGIVCLATNGAYGVDNCTFNGTIHDTTAGVEQTTAGITALVNYDTCQHKYYISGSSCGSYSAFGDYSVDSSGYQADVVVE